MTYANKLDNLDKTEKCIEGCKLPKVMQEVIENLVRPILSKEIELKKTEFIIKKHLTKKSPGSSGLSGKLYQIFEKKNHKVLYKLFQKIEEEETLFNFIYNPDITSIMLIPKPIKHTTKKRKS